MLPIAGSGPTERADAARNRRKIVQAAAKLVAAKGIDGLALDEVAAEAGVGIGTVYRRFPDKGALAQALLDENEREFQEAFISGPPPLGPGAPAQAKGSARSWKRTSTGSRRMASCSWSPRRRRRWPGS